MRKEIGKVEYLLWASLFLALVGSLKSLADVFAGVDDNLLMGWLKALAVDLGVFALAYGVKERGGKWVWGGLFSFVLISVYGNLVYGMGTR